MSSHDSFVSSGSSPTLRKKDSSRSDIAVENHGCIILLRPVTRTGIDWLTENIGVDNGYQPYFPTVIVEPRYLDEIVLGIRKDSLVVYMLHVSAIN